MVFDGKTYRNLQDQVGYLTGKYDDLQDQINDVRGKLTHYVVVDTLPTGDDIDPSAVYLLGPMGTAPDTYYEEWVYVQKADETWMWEKLGDTDSVDLSGYLQKVTTATTRDQLYGKQADGGQIMYDVTDNNEVRTVVRRTADNQINTSLVPSSNWSCTSKKYVDDNFLAKQTETTTYAKAYVKNADGTQGLVDVTDARVSNAIVQRDNNGQIYVPDTPDSGNRATSKKYVDDNFLAKQTGTSTYAQAYAKATDGNQGMVSMTYQIVSGTIVQRNAAGAVLVPLDPFDQYSAVSKKYVDDAVGQLLYLHEIDLTYTIDASTTLGIKCYLVNGDPTAITSLTRAIFKRITASYGALNPDESDTNACAITKMADSFRQDEFDEPYASFLYQYYSGGSLTSGNTFGITPTVTDVVVSF